MIVIITLFLFLQMRLRCQSKAQASIFLPSLFLSIPKDHDNSNLKDNELDKKRRRGDCCNMAKLLVLYDSQTGNSEKIADAVAEVACDIVQYI